MMRHTSPSTALPVTVRHTGCFNVPSIFAKAFPGIFGWIPMQTTRRCKICWKRADLQNAESSMSGTERRELHINGRPRRCRFDACPPSGDPQQTRFSLPKRENHRATPVKTKFCNACKHSRQACSLSAVLFYAFLYVALYLATGAIGYKMRKRNPRFASVCSKISCRCSNFSPVNTFSTVSGFGKRT